MKKIHVSLFLSLILGANTANSVGLSKLFVGFCAGASAYQQLRSPFIPHPPTTLFMSQSSMNDFTDKSYRFDVFASAINYNTSLNNPVCEAFLDTFGKANDLAQDNYIKGAKVVLKKILNDPQFSKDEFLWMKVLAIKSLVDLQGDKDSVYTELTNALRLSKNIPQMSLRYAYDIAEIFLDLGMPKKTSHILWKILTSPQQLDTSDFQLKINAMNGLYSLGESKDLLINTLKEKIDFSLLDILQKIDLVNLFMEFGCVQEARDLFVKSLENMGTPNLRWILDQISLIKSFMELDDFNQDLINLLTKMLRKHITSEAIDEDDRLSIAKLFIYIKKFRNAESVLMSIPNNLEAQRILEKLQDFF